MPDLELRQLTYLIAVAETGSITRAAQRLRITQPALSRAVKTLERTVGVPLFLRRPHATELTAAGSVLLGEAYELVGRAGRAVERARDTRTLQVAVAGCDVLTVMATARAAGVPAQIVPFDWKMDLAQLRSGAVDVALLRDCFDRDGLHFVPVSTEPRVMVLSDNHPLAGTAAPTLAEVRDAPIACLRGMSPAERAHWAGADVDTRPWRPGPEVAGVSELITELRLGRSIAFVPASALHDVGDPAAPLPGIVTRPVEGLSPSRLEAAVATTDPAVRDFAYRLSSEVVERDRFPGVPQQ
ncbi:LysR family transcriptional regulator [Actinoplanes couchii]|uniref:LysR family transcriptional regulator n=1 Tax=Actinoplanes couchii TaxID=403638 RepID=A0ABQ3XEY5_9ACTN|nr:LysR family transcriptional regulator [Actinoplanes couchii]MDR6319927.1 DNA-binding transcriptional LysR family regulator [Actinoplanes couchii]GID57064.1 LysR family transcriptional regulator [Actinoplanes couchii]